MHENTHTGFFTTISAVAGGLGKLLITKPLVLNVTVNGLLTVMAYAAASAVVGYVVKIILDVTTRFFVKRFVQEKEEPNE
jgi:hypothetical protein